MSFWKVISRSVRYYWQTHLGVVLGSALGAMVLIGSLLVGDSVKETLRQQALLRVGKADFAMVGGDRFFREELAGSVTGNAAPVLLLRGSAVRADGQGRINQAQVLGVDQRFWALSPEAKVPGLAETDIALNSRAAAQLGVKVGDTVVIRMEKPSAFSRDAPLSGEEAAVIAIRAKIGAVVDDQSFGRFSLQASQVAPFSIFVPLKTLQARLEMAAQANVLLAAAAGDTQLNSFQQQIERGWQLADAALALKRVEKTGELELRTSRVFLDPPVVKAAPRGLDALTYLVNELRAGDKATPYSMATAIDAASSGFLPAELADDEIAITQWLAEDLGVGLNDRITVKYFVMGE
ncbi:MAG TPA: ABC transporter permease, partial [Chthoniobacteraceae bacterium]